MAAIYATRMSFSVTFGVINVKRKPIHASLHRKPCYQIIWYSIEGICTKVINALPTLSNYTAQVLQGLVSSKPAGKSNYSS